MNMHHHRHFEFITIWVSVSMTYPCFLFSAPTVSWIMATHHQNTTELHELISCDICAESYDNETHRAKFLECYHTFCSQCLFLLVDKRPRRSGNIQCPNCRHPTQIPENGIEGLQTNFYIEKFKAVSTTSEQAKTLPNTEGCCKHSNQPLVFFCETCSIVVCRDCTVLDHERTAGHSIVNFKDAVDKQRHILQDALNASCITRTQNQKVIHQIESEVEKRNICRDSTITNLRSVIRSARRQLEQGEQEVTNVILQKHETQQSAMLDKQLQIQQATKLMNKYVSQSEEVMKASDIFEMIHITEKLQTATELAKLDYTTFGVGETYLASDIISGATPLNDSLYHLGRNYFRSFLPNNVVLKSNTITAGLKSVLSIELLNDDGDKILTAACLLTVKITDPNGTKLPVTLNTSHPECTVTFTPQRSGMHETTVMYMGEELSGGHSHIDVSSNNPVLKFGRQGYGAGTFNSPRDIAIDNNDCLYVADTGNGVIQKFSAEGVFLSQFCVDECNESYSAFNVVLDLNKGLIICTKILTKDNAAVEGNTVLLFNHEGDLQHTFALSDVSCPLNLALNSQENILISDSRGGWVIETDQGGKLISRIGDVGRPGYICSSDDYGILVSDIRNHCIHILNHDGLVKRQIGSPGSGKGQLEYPFGLATDGENILVADGANDRIQVFRYDGTFVSVIESRGDPLDEPRGLAITKDGYVYVVDRDNHCIKKYKYRDMPW